MGCVCGKELLEIDNRRFRVKKRLGEGAFSYVYLVHEEGTGRLYAVKRIICHSKRDEQRVLNEIGVHDKIGDHPNVLRCEGHSVEKLNSQHAIVAYGQQNGAHEVISAIEYNLLLPYYKRGTLLEELMWRQVSGDHICELRVLKLFKGVCDAVKAFHSLQPVAYAHRDLKPGNVLLANDDSSILMDLGSAAPARVQVLTAKEAQALQDEAAEHCTMTYRAPELFHIDAGARIDERTDIWSLGCLLYAMCFFKSPFDLAHERGDSVALAVIGGNVQIPTSSPYTPGVHHFILSMLRVDPSERPQSIDEVLNRLNELIRVAPPPPTRGSSATSNA